ncbi:diacylglycerol kinase family protein [Allofustis seminis]|uniref:diacylglycerol kinase family protein n=1 Tax=Allofustis seminis TaxID=166939 RepID=UPI00037ADA8D|nr:diacylglycerol kinase family protein [Allofustis seminis]
MNKKTPFQNKTFLASFRYAFSGIRTAFSEERNMKSHILSSFLAICLGIYYSLSLYEWLLILIVIHLVIAMEIINTALENVVDFVSLEYNKDAKKIKDMSAAAVLIISFLAAIVGAAIFLPKIFN